MDQDATRPARKRRAAQACKSCRTRKVRCDLVATGFPPGCTNCKLDGITCELMGNKRRKTVHLPQDHIHDAVPPVATSVDGAGSPDVLHDPNTAASSISVTDHAVLSNGGRDEHADIETADTAPSSTTTRPFLKLPPYVQSLSSTLTSDDLGFLNRKGALVVPPRSFLRIVLCRYIEFVHPGLPLLDAHSCLVAINDESGQSGTISILLLLAIVYASLPFVELKHVRTLGFTSKLDARTAYYKKIKLLYDLDVESDTIVLTQATLLTSTPHGSMDAIHDAWYWIGLGISHAHSIGLHLDIGNSDRNDAKRRLRRRLWWCCFIREQVVAMGLGRPTRITYYNVPMLSISDFDIVALSESIHTIPAQCPVARDTKAQQTLAVILIEKAKLCVSVGRAVSVMCTIRDHTSRSPVNACSRILSEATSCAKELDDWATMLSVEAAYDMNAAATYKLSERSLITARASLHMVYYDTICLLNRPLALATSLPSTFSDSFVSAEESRRLIRWAAKELVRINWSLYELGLLSYLDATSVANVVAAIMVNLLDVKSEVRSLKDSAIHALQRCIEILRVLKITYGSAIHAYRFLEMTLKSEEFPKPQKDQSYEQQPRNRMQSIEQLSTIFSPEEMATSPSANGLVSGQTPTQLSSGTSFEPHFFGEDFPMDDWLRGEDHWLMPNFGTMDLPTGYQL